MHNKPEVRVMIIRFAVVLFIVLLDQIVKALVVQNMYIGETIPVLQGIIGLRYTINTGAGWSILEGQRALLIAAPTIASIAMVYAIIKGKIRSRVGSWGITLILSGAVGNLIDRIFRGGAVVDMFNFEFINFPVFNVADIGVTIGAVLFFVYVIFFFDDKAEKKDE